MDDLIAFLYARLDDDERVAQTASERGGPHWPSGDGDRASASLAHARRHDPARVLREVETKRRIVGIHGLGMDPCDAHDASFATVPCDTLKLIAHPYADHHDYQEGWKP